MLERAFQDPNFRICGLGSFKLVEAASGTDMTPASRKARALIGYLCIVGKPVGRERLASLLWGDRGDEQARASLRQAIYELRSMLAGNRLLKMERDTVAIGEDVSTDIAAIMAAAKSGDLERLGHALSEWRGDFFEDMPSIDESFDTWLRSERLRVQESLVNAAAEAAKAGMERGEIDAARKIVGLLQQRDRTNEVVLRLALKLDHLAGDTGALHRRYERFRELLKSELNAAPAVVTQQLFRELTTKSPASRTEPNGDAADRVKEYVRQTGEDGVAGPAEPRLAQSAAKAETETRISRPPGRSGGWIRIAAVALAVVSLGTLAWVVWSSLHNAAPSRQPPLIAVLPFQNLSADLGSRYFSDEFAEEVAGALLQTTHVRIASPRFGFRDASTLQSAKAPAAPFVLSGSVERMGDRIRVVAQLMDIHDDSAVWSRAYDRAVAQTPALRHDIAVQIAGALDTFLSANSLGEIRRRDPAAYDHYLKGRNLLLRQRPDAAAVELDASLRLDPNFSNAWSTLAAARWLLAADTLIEHPEGHDSSMTQAARTAAQRALTLDPDNGEALGVLALLIPSMRLQEIDRQLERALRSAPNDTQVLEWRGGFLMLVGRNREGLDELTRAYELDPATPSVASKLALALLETGQFEEAREIIGRIDPGRDNRLRSDLLSLHVKYFLYRRDWSGLANNLSALPNYLSPQRAAILRLCRETAIALATREAGKFGALRTRWRTQTPVDTDDAVQFLSALGDVDGALEVLQSAVKSRRNDEILTDPAWEALFAQNLAGLRRDPRVPALLAQWGLFDYWRAANHWPDFMR